MEGAMLPQYAMVEGEDDMVRKNISLNSFRIQVTLYFGD